MAVTLADLAVDLRVITNPEDTIEPGQIVILTRLLAVAETLVSERASSAPDALKDSAVIQIASYLYDKPTAGAAGRFANSFVNSGAASLLANYIRRRAKAIGPGAEAVSQNGTPSTPTQGVDEDAVRALLADWAEEGNVSPIPVSKLSEARGVDPSARDAAQAASEQAVSAQTRADAAQAAATTAQAAAAAAQAAAGVDPSARNAAQAASEQAVSAQTAADNAQATAAAAQTAAEAAQTTANAKQTVAQVTALIATAFGAAAGARVFVRTSALNIALQTPSAAEAGNIVLTLVGGSLNLYRRIDTNSTPFWEHIGAVSGGAVTSVAAAPIVLVDALLIPDPGSTVTPRALTLSADLVAGRDLEFLDTRASLYSIGYIRSDRILALPPVSGTATRSSPGGVGLKTFQTGTTAFGHGAMLLWRHADADKIWFADGRTNAATLTITAY